MCCACGGGKKQPTGSYYQMETNVLALNQRVPKKKKENSLRSSRRTVERRRPRNANGSWSKRKTNRTSIVTTNLTLREMYVQLLATFVRNRKCKARRYKD